MSDQFAPAPPPASLPDSRVDARADLHDNALTATDISRINAIIETHRHRPGALLPILHAVQATFGFIPAAATPLIAAALDYSRAEVHGVISFYPHFRQHPTGRHIVQLCRAEACQSVGARGLEAHAKQALGIDFHQTTADGAITLEPVYCLGNCACGPSLRVADEVVGRVSTQRFDALISALRSEPQ